MSDYKPYPEYKNSGVDWLGPVPEHWTVKKLKWLASLKSGEFITSESIDEDGEYPVFGGNGLRGYATGFTHDGSFALIGRQGALCGNINYARERFWASEHAVVVSPNEPTNTIWLGEMLRAMNLNQYSVSAAQPGLAVERVIDLQVPIPFAKEQEEISIFLKNETTRIDGLVNKKNRFIELLREKRQALITHAVTKGLDPSATMKDSGVEWLGEVPAHWGVCKVQHIILGIEQGWSPECLSRPAEQGDWGVVKAGCVNGGFFTDSENKTLPLELSPKPEYEIKVGNVLMSRASGSQELIGSVALVMHTQKKLMLSDKIFRIHCSAKMTPEFFVWMMGATPLRAQIKQAVSGADGLANNLPQSRIKEFWIACPPIGEQATIVQLICLKTSRINMLIAQTERSIELLKERRSALITAAVTGQIDLREAA